VKEANFSFKFRHYVNLGTTLSKLKRLIISFPHARFTTCSELILSHQGEKGQRKNDSPPAALEAQRTQR
jgi:hypothetical protein